MSEAIGLVDTPVATASTRRGFIREVMFGSRVALIGFLVLLFFVIIAIIGPWIEPYSTTTQVGPVYAPPSSQHWLGLDDGGIDMLSEVIAGARVSMIVGFAGAAVAMIIGGGVGLLSGYFGNKTDIFLMRITDYFLVIPDVPLMIVAAAVFGRSTLNVVLIIGIIYWTSTARLIRAQVKSVRERVYVANTVLTIAIAVFAETYIAFLGLEDPSTISWGKLIQNSLSGGAIFHKAWWAIIPPGLCVTIVILAATMMGQAMEDALNPRLRVGHLSVRRFRLRPLRGRLESE
jgi:peptide/nickel transport system permease protein